MGVADKKLLPLINLTLMRGGIMKEITTRLVQMMSGKYTLLHSFTFYAKPKEESNPGLNTMHTLLDAGIIEDMNILQQYEGKEVGIKVVVTWYSSMETGRPCRSCHYNVEGVCFNKQSMEFGEYTAEIPVPNGAISGLAEPGCIDHVNKLVPPHSAQ